MIVRLCGLPTGGKAQKKPGTFSIRLNVPGLFVGPARQMPVLQIQV